MTSTNSSKEGDRHFGCQLRPIWESKKRKNKILPATKGRPPCFHISWTCLLYYIYAIVSHAEVPFRSTKSASINSVLLIAYLSLDKQIYVWRQLVDEINLLNAKHIYLKCWILRNTQAEKAGSCNWQIVIGIGFRRRGRRSKFKWHLKFTCW